MAIDDNSLTVFNRQLEVDALSKPVGTGAMTAAAKVANVVSQVPPLRPLGLIAKGLDLAVKCLTIGVPTVEENLKLFGNLTEEALLRVEQELVGLKAGKEKAEEFQRRVESKEFSDYLACGVLQTQRTTQQSRLRRMAWIIANGVKEGDLALEGGDDMMRAAAELKEADVLVLRRICVQQASILREHGEVNGSAWGKAVAKSWHEAVERSRGQSIDEARLNNLDWKSSLSRLTSLGFLSPTPSEAEGDDPNPHMPYGLLNQGLKFIERLEEIH